MVGKWLPLKVRTINLNITKIKGRVTLPHPKDLPIGTLKSVLKQAKIKINNE
jgi:predicted RNA binding protein YcfA (HicA-like mRNA interferase family)